MFETSIGRSFTEAAKHAKRLQKMYHDKIVQSRNENVTGSSTEDVSRGHSAWERHKKCAQISAKYKLWTRNNWSCYLIKKVHNWRINLYSHSSTVFIHRPIHQSIYVYYHSQTIKNLWTSVWIKMPMSEFKSSIQNGTLLNCNFLINGS